MAIEVGSKIQGKVTGITKFGAFVEVEPGKTGLVHISEVADKYVENISEFLSVGDEVTVKVMKVEDDGKIGLSIRKAQDRPQEERPKSSGSGRPKSGGDRPRGGSKPQQQQRPASFEDKMSSFMKDSEERLATIRKQTEKKGKKSRK